MAFEIIGKEVDIAGKWRVQVRLTEGESTLIKFQEEPDLKDEKILLKINEVCENILQARIDEENTRQALEYQPSVEELQKQIAELSTQLQEKDSVIMEKEELLSIKDSELIAVSKELSLKEEEVSLMKSGLVEEKLKGI